MDLKRKVCIISKEPDPILKFILEELRSGATIYEAYGPYDHKTRREIITIVDKQEFRRLMDYMKKHDPRAFITVYSVNGINYTPKK